MRWVAAPCDHERDSRRRRSVGVADIATPAQLPTATVHTVRNIDPATGLVIDARDTIETRLGDGSTIHMTLIETVVTLQLAP